MTQVERNFDISYRTKSAHRFVSMCFDAVERQNNAASEDERKRTKADQK